MVSMRRTSDTLHGSALSWPMRNKLSSAGRLMAISYQSHRGLREDPVDKRIRFCAAPVKFGGRVTNWIDFAPELSLQWNQQLQHAPQQQVFADQHHVNITYRRITLLGHGTKKPCVAQCRG